MPEGNPFMIVVIALALASIWFDCGKSTSPNPTPATQVEVAEAPKTQPTVKFQVNYKIHFATVYTGAPDSYVPWQGERVIEVPAHRQMVFNGLQDRGDRSGRGGRNWPITLPVNDLEGRGALSILFTQPNGDHCVLKVGTVDGVIDCPGFWQNARIPGTFVNVKVVRTGPNDITILVAPNVSELGRMKA